jgi:hypothetical protein
MNIQSQKDFFSGMVFMAVNERPTRNEKEPACRARPAKTLRISSLDLYPIQPPQDTAHPWFYRMGFILQFRVKLIFICCSNSSCLI